ncbi:hypothetical protein ACIP6I_03945 [Streptomyces anulatus]
MLERDAAKVFERGKKDRPPYMTFVFPARPEYTGAARRGGPVDLGDVRETVKVSNPMTRRSELQGS